jgi:geranylgeranyl pyrophosphate synthase
VGFRVTETKKPYGPVSSDIGLVGEGLRDLTTGHHPLLGKALEHVFSSHGKQLRPALVMLSGKLGTYERDRLVTLAMALELVHTASLVHDDTVDEALTRRGLETLNAIWNPKVAVLVGDFLFAQAAELAARLGTTRVMTVLAETVMAMTSGELRQQASSSALLVDEADYFLRISGKTAALFRACCEGAGLVSDQTEACIQALSSYGSNLGIAFQIADDVLDFTGDEETLGKPAGSDLRQGTITLPVILWAEDLNGHALGADLRHGRNLEEIIGAVRRSNAPARALQRAAEYAAAARRDLSGFPGSEAKDILVDLTREVVSRQR